MSIEIPNELNHKPYNWRLLGILVVAVLLSVILITPYSLSLQSNTLATAKLPLPLPILLPLQWLQTTILYGILAAIGLFIANRIGLGAPFLESWLAGKPEWDRVRKFAIPAIIGGVLAAIAIIVLDAVVFSPPLSAELKRLGTNVSLSSITPPAWDGFLASFYGGITEEIFCASSCFRSLRGSGDSSTAPLMAAPDKLPLWIANILAAILFGLGHLPITAASGLPMDALVITRAVVLNGLAGLVFGWFYWKHGLEAAMVSHFSSDIILHVIPPLLMGH